MSEASSKKKRKYFDSGSEKNKWRKWSATNSRPKRGAPGMLLTCETGREQKCKREGLEILNFYLPTSDQAATSDNQKGQEEDGIGTTELSLEEELKSLKSKKGPSEPSGFGVYDTSCRGTVFVLCTLPNCSLIPTIQTEYMLKKKNETENKVVDTDVNVSNKKLKSEKADAAVDTECEDPAVSVANDPKSDDGNPVVQETPPPWDPITTLRTILSDIDNDSNKEVPRSRFVTRMIPIQATCFASPEELQLTCSELLKKYMSRSTKTFAIVFKRRNCSNLNRNGVIEIVGKLMTKMFPDCKVDLGKPDATIVVEVCGTLCGLSIVENVHEFRKFNLLGATTGE